MNPGRKNSHYYPFPPGSFQLLLLGLHFILCKGLGVGAYNRGRVEAAQQAATA